MKKGEITLCQGHALKMGEYITFHEDRAVWQRFVRWILRKRDPLLKITKVTTTTITYETVKDV